MKMIGCITYEEALDAGTVLIDKWLDAIYNNEITFMNDDFKRFSIEHCERAKAHLIDKYCKAR